MSHRPRTTTHGAGSSSGASGLAIARTREGAYFTTSQFFLGVQLTQNMLLRVGPTFNAYLTVRLTVSLHSQLTIYEAPTITSAGTPLVVTNLNRTSSRVAETLAFHSSDVSNVGLRLYDEMTGEGLKVDMGGPEGVSPLLICNKSTDYLILGAPESIGTDIYLSIGWYEGF